MADEVTQFDPRKVERYYGARDGYEVVTGEDYDKLLALWEQSRVNVNFQDAFVINWVNYGDVGKMPGSLAGGIFRPDLLNDILQVSPAIALSDLADAITRGQLKAFSASVQGNGMHGGDRVVFDVRFSLEVIKVDQDGTVSLTDELLPGEPTSHFIARKEKETCL